MNLPQFALERKPFVLVMAFLLSRGATGAGDGK